MAEIKEEGKKPSKAKKVFKTIGLIALAGLAGLAIYDHRHQIANGTVKTVDWAKSKFARNRK